MELSEYNFTKLNTPESHPAREWSDTFYLTEDSSVCLRTQTSPMQIRAMYQVRGANPVYQPLPRFPSVNRDIAIVCDASIPVARLEECISHAGGDYLKNVELFDIYTGTHIADGKKSVAFSLTMRADDQTLTDEHADDIVNSALEALNRELGAVIR